MDIDSLIEQTRGWADTARACGNGLIGKGFDEAADGLEKAKTELQELRMQSLSDFGQYQTLCENAEEAWIEYVGKFDTYSSQWQDKGCDDIYKDGFKAGVLSVCK